MSEDYSIKCEVDHLTVEFFLNDIPIIRCSQRGWRDYREDVNEYLIDGLNTLTAVVNPGELPSVAKVGDEASETFSPVDESMKVFLTKGGDANSRGRCILYLGMHPTDLSDSKRRLRSYKNSRIKLSSEGSSEQRILEGEIHEYPMQVTEDEGVDKVLYRPGEPLEGPFTVSTSLELNSIAKKEWAWQRGKASLENEDRKEISAFLQKIHKALATGDFQTYIDIAKEKFEDFAVAYRKDRSRHEQQFSGQFTRVLKDGGKLEALNEEECDLRLCANNRMIQCCLQDGTPIFKYKHDDTTYKIPMFISKIDGEWRIVL
ncbi:MAG: hypothetical protein NE330_16715 [Lentisphaeraceae bacterium]|nr:hypothetical protein [Lentisphaeraceae bacterium]